MITALGNTDQRHYGTIFSDLAHNAVGYKPRKVRSVGYAQQKTRQGHIG